jgi:hypothetical protein
MDKHALGRAMLFGLVLATPFLSWGSSSSGLNSVIGLWQALFVILYLSEVKEHTITIFKESLTFRLTVLLLILSLIGMLAFNFSYIKVTRTWIYCMQPFFFVAAVSWFKDQADAGMIGICICKMMSVVVVTLILISILTGLDGHNITRRDVDLFLYNNIRQYNFDLAFGFMMGTMAWLVMKFKRRLHVFQYMFFIMLGFATMFTEGRGQILCLSFFCIIVYSLGRKSTAAKVQSKAIFSFSIGVVLLLILYPAVVDAVIGRTVLNDINSVSSKRLEIWLDSFNTWLEAGGSVPPVVFGLGPDSFRLVMAYPGIVQPHNSVIQALMEYGLLGLFFLMWLFFKVLHNLAVIWKSRQVEGLPMLVSCALLSMFAYSLTDGIFYHGVPIAICVVMGAYLFAKDRERKCVNEG